jgi:ribonuclease HI
VGLIIHVDGGSRGNPGPAAAGVVIRYEDGRKAHEAGYFLGTLTNNAAEYTALILALQRAARLGSHALHIRSDSELLVRQLTGQYRVKSPALEPLFHQTQLLLLKVPRWKIEHVRRESNARADELANLALDRRRDVIVYDIDDPAAPDAAGVPPEPAAPIPGVELKIGERRIDVHCVRRPEPGCCAAGDVPEHFSIGATAPAGVCVYALHALLPTVLAIHHTDAEEFAAVPSMTVRCTRSGCGATFQVAPAPSGNGHGR